MFKDGYNEHYSYDDCILNKVSENFHDLDIKDILKSKDNRRVSKGFDESLFIIVADQLENIRRQGGCNDPNLKLQTTFTLTSLNNLNGVSTFETGNIQPFNFDLEFPTSTLVKEVRVKFLR